MFKVKHHSQRLDKERRSRVSVLGCPLFFRGSSANKHWASVVMYFCLSVTNHQASTLHRTNSSTLTSFSSYMFVFQFPFRYCLSFSPSSKVTFGMADATEGNRDFDLYILRIWQTKFLIFQNTVATLGTQRLVSADFSDPPLTEECVYIFPPHMSLIKI